MLGKLIQELEQKGPKLSEGQKTTLENYIMGYTNQDFQEAMEIVDWFERTPDPEFLELMHRANVLSCKSVKLASMVGDLGKDYAEAHVNRRLKGARDVVRLSDEMAVSKAKEAALVEGEEWYRKEYKYQAAKDRGRLIVSAVNNVLDRMRQLIADLRQDRN